MSTDSTNTLGRYQIIREIGRSNDVVYEAYDPVMDRYVALKELQLPPNVSGAQRRERIERFRREAKAAARLNHPNIVTVYEYGEENDRYYFAMEMIHGQTLRDVIQAGGPLSLPDAMNYALQLCSALQSAHDRGVIHRDIKPENIYILTGGLIKITDFGIARLMGESPITQDGQVFGTPSYMSPEQVAGKTIDARSDIFSLGVVIYEMLAGRKPFAGDSIVTVTYNIMNMEPPPPPGVPPWLVGVIRKAMAKDPNARYSSAAEMAEDIREQRCAGMFAPQPDSYGAYPSSFGGVSQDPFATPPGAYPPPAGPAVPQFPPAAGGTGGGGPATPYGAPTSWQDPGGLPVAVPSPFGQSGSQPPTASQSGVPAPPAPILSSETRNFLGVLMLVVGLAAMLVFAIWAVNLAFSSYQKTVSAEHAARYFNQGTRLYNQGDTDGAIEQWRHAMRVAPDSDAAKAAEENIFRALVNRAYQIATAGADGRHSLMDQAQELIRMRPAAPEGHYYAGWAYEQQGDLHKAKEEYRKAEQYGGNDKYAIAARERIAAIDAASPSSAPSDSDVPAPPPSAPPDSSGIPFEPAY